MRSQWRFAALAAMIGAAALAYYWSTQETPAPHEFIVSIEDGVSVDSLRRGLAGAVARVDAIKPLQGNLHLVTVTASGSKTRIAERLAGVPGVKEVEPNTEMRRQK